MQNNPLFDEELYSVINFKLMGDYKLYLKFDDESEKIIDFRPILSGRMFGALQDRDLFNQVQLDHDLGTLIWPNGADIDPTVLHDWEEHVDAIIARRQKKTSLLEKTAVIS